MCRRSIMVMLTGVVLLAIGLVACNTGESDAMRAIRTNSDGTIAALGNRIKTMEATNAEVDKVLIEVDNLRTMVSDEREQNRRLVAQQNGGGNPGTNPNVAATTAPLALPVDPNAALTPAGNTGGAIPTNVANPNGLAIDRITTARGTNNADGCALNETNTFTAADSKIWVIAYVRNLKSGTAFKSAWAIGGTIPQEFNWTANFSSARTCINFYIEPKTLNIDPGDYNVTISAPGATAGVNFKIQGAAGTTNTGATTPATPAR